MNGACRRSRRGRDPPAARRAARHRRAFVERLLGEPLDDPIRVVTGQPAFHEREQDPLGEQCAVGDLEVLPHPRRRRRPSRRRARAPGAACGRGGSSSRAGYALDRGVRDVALVPQRDVLDAGLALPRSTRASPVTCSDLIGLRLWGIALSPSDRRRTARAPPRPRCGRGAGARCEPLEPAPASAIAWSSSACGPARRPGSTPARRRGRAFQDAAQSRATWRCTCRRRRTGHRRSPGGTLLQALLVARRLEREPGELDPERRRLGVDAVGAPDAERVDVARAPASPAPRRAAAPPEHDVGDRLSCSARPVSRTSLEVSP